MVASEVRVLPAARRHGVPDVDMMHAYRYALHIGPAPGHPDGETQLVIGPARSAGLLELVVVNDAEGPVVFHAMPLRRTYERYLTPRRRP